MPKLTSPLPPDRGLQVAIGVIDTASEPPYAVDKPLCAPNQARKRLIPMRTLLRHLRFLVAVQLLPALESGEETLVGGQAVLEGVMMRSPHAWGISVRKPDGTISTHSEPLERLSEKHKWMGWPVIRGVMTLGQAMVLGFRALRYSADVALDPWPCRREGKQRQRRRDQRLGRGAQHHLLGRLLHLPVQVCAAGRATKLKNVYPVFGNQVAVQRG